MSKKLIWVLVAILIPAFSYAEPNSIDNAVYFRSQVKDSSQCSLIIQDDKLIFPSSITNPAASCPDAFAWKKFLEAIRDKFWENWAYDSFNWPQKPYALSKGGDDTASFCDPSKKNNPGYDNKSNPGIHCPYFPGDHVESGKQGVTVGNSVFKQHFSQLQTGHPSIIQKLDPGRVIRQEMAEVVYRNRPMWLYIFKNNLYNKSGLAAKFKKTKKTIAENAPYRYSGVRIEFPIDSVMFKTDWLHEDEAKNLGLLQNSKHPYITQYMKSPVGDNDPSRFREGLHYLVAITAASKDLPNWHWYAMEHVDNPGRCDYTGCNDSFGYTSPDKLPNGYEQNFIKPITQTDGLVSPSPIFKTGQKYPSGNITPALSIIFKKLGIGQSDDGDHIKPSIVSKAWLSYRLKGSQTEFVSADGINTIVGNSVTEGGFVNTSSCITCHAQASVDVSGKPAISSFGFSSDLNLFGYQRSTNGAPQPSWFYQPGTNSPTAIQTDFVWGILFAHEIAQPSHK